MEVVAAEEAPQEVPQEAPQAEAGGSRKKRKGELAGYKGPKLRPEEKKDGATFGGDKTHRVERPDEVSRAW